MYRLPFPPLHGGDPMPNGVLYLLEGDRLFAFPFVDGRFQCGMLTYCTIVTPYLAYLGFAGGLTGVLQRGASIFKAPAGNCAAGVAIGLADAIDLIEEHAGLIDHPVSRGYSASGDDATC
jgi:hypothetical protein